MKRVIYVIILPLVVAGGLVFANREANNETQTSSPTAPTATEGEAILKQWEATPDGVKFKQWEASEAGKKVYASEAKIRRQLSSFTNMEAVITSLTLPPGSRLGFGMMARINGDDFILSFGPQTSNEFQQLQSLKVNDKIILRSRNVSHAPKYAFPIISGEYVERDSKVLYKRAPRKGGC